ncbi:helix-turn-helix domain-containing protein [Streptomyces inhibens]|uniref:helix-turn-helix domain-containing protein n=1 Tax=Streptomyces inhibens TaxID=2293571 RepID=UPI0037B2DC3B
MAEQERREFGVRVAELRRRRGLTQTELGSALGRTASWVSQVERGIQPVNRLDLLRLPADGLGVSLQVLQPEAPSAPEPEAAGEAPQNDLDQARLAISGHSALDVLLEPREDAQRRQFGDALESLLKAEHVAPGVVRSHIAVRAVIRELVLVAGRAASPELRGLAERSDALA